MRVSRESGCSALSQCSQVGLSSSMAGPISEVGRSEGCCGQVYCNVGGVSIAAEAKSEGKNVQCQIIDVEWSGRVAKCALWMMR